ncbi:MAG TPA: hypothetical protein VF064_03925, partial [Pyrinomonadaceae bacterium]
MVDVKCELRGTVYTIPDFELEFTRPGGWRFYRMIGVRDGRENWTAETDEEGALVLTPKMVEELGGAVDWHDLLV